MSDDTAPEAQENPGDTQTPIAGSLPPTPIVETEAPATGSGRREAAFMGVPIEVMVSVGKARPLVADLVRLRRDSVVTLNSKIDDPVELYVGERLIARGELQEMDDGTGRLGVRLTEVADLSKGV